MPMNEDGLTLKEIPLYATRGALLCFLSLIYACIKATTYLCHREEPYTINDAFVLKQATRNAIGLLGRFVLPCFQVG